jgi:hypothetical protein
VNIFDKRKKKRKGPGGNGGSDSETEEEAIEAPEVDETLAMLSDVMKETAVVHREVSHEVELAKRRERDRQRREERRSGGGSCWC